MMGRTTGISWCDATHNFWYGCQKVSQGCKHCYAEREMTRYGHDFRMVTRAKGFDAPLRWKEPRKVFVNSWSDFFIEEADPWRDAALAIMALTPHLTYQVLTKRPERMYAYMTDPQTPCRIAQAMERGEPPLVWPLPHCWFGVSVEDQATADARIPWLLKTPAAVRFLSAEPLLSAINLRKPLCGCVTCGGYQEHGQWPRGLDWVIVGGESGPHARPCDLDWLRSVVRQCAVAAVPVWVKQLGSTPTLHGCTGLPIKDRKGADPAEWPDDVRVQHMPPPAEARGLLPDFLGKTRGK